ncbi:hypothetical protein BC827DRAFT_1132040 [Russula dissimulans]|nr:hypothetical protein BC827DRAFT_1132040 [Russula dissimulans]
MSAQTTPPVLNIKRKRAPKPEQEVEESDSHSAAAEATKRAKSSSNNQIKRRKSKAKARLEEADEQTAAPRPLVPPSGEEELAPIPAKLTFSLADAKAHLVRADRRFGDVFARLPCKPFERLESVHPFRSVFFSLSSGQQISWSAARAIQHKFLRLYFPELPEKPDDDYWTKSRQDVHPTAYQVATTDLATLKTAGLSGRKAEYVRDLATRFADGRLTNQKLLVANDEELFELLTAVYGIGRVSLTIAVEMFAIFSLRRPDILPVGDLGVQRGLLRWMLSLHQPAYRIEISPKKLPDPTQDPREAENQSKQKPKPTPAQSGKETKGVRAPASTEVDSDQEAEQEGDELPSLNGYTSAKERLERGPTPPSHQESSTRLPAAAVSSTIKSDEVSLGTPLRRRDNKTAVAAQSLTPGALGLPSMPPPLTPSVTQVLSRAPDAPAPPPLPMGLTVASLRSRLDGKKKIKGAILTPAEMEALTESWRPYRSIGVYYMWALAEEKVAS